MMQKELANQLLNGSVLEEADTHGSVELNKVAYRNVTYARRKLIHQRE